MLNFSRHISIVLLATALLLIAGCQPRGEKARYRFDVSLTLDDSLRHDSCATLHIIDDTYGRLMPGITAYFTDGSVSFSGQTSNAHAAFATFDSITPPFYFILEPTTIDIHIRRGRWTMTGGRGNAEYVQFLNHRQRIIDARQKGFADCKRAALDSTLTLRSERQAVIADSVLADSLQHLLLNRMRGDNPVSRIVRERFIGTLTPSSLRQLNLK